MLAKPKPRPRLESESAGEFLYRYIQCHSAYEAGATVQEAARDLVKRYHKPAPQDLLVRRVCLGIEASLHWLFDDCDAEAAEHIIDELLLFDPRMDKAQSESDEQRAQDVLQPACRYFMQYLEKHLKCPVEFDVKTAFGHIFLSQLPFQIGNRIYVRIPFEDEDYHIKLVFHMNEDFNKISEDVCRKMRKYGHFTKTLTEERVRKAIRERVREGPPYYALILLETHQAKFQKISLKNCRVPPSSFFKASYHRLPRHPHFPPPLPASSSADHGNKPNDDSNDADDDDDDDYDYGDDDDDADDSELEEEEEEEDETATADRNASHTEHAQQGNNEMCIDCYKARREVQEDLLRRLKLVMLKLKKQNNQLMREIFNPI